MKKLIIMAIVAFMILVKSLMASSDVQEKDKYHEMEMAINDILADKASFDEKMRPEYLEALSYLGDRLEKEVMVAMAIFSKKKDGGINDEMLQTFDKMLLSVMDLNYRYYKEALRIQVGSGEEDCTALILKIESMLLDYEAGKPLKFGQ